MKKSIIYTGKGDKGTTSLVGGQRVSKTDIRIDSYGTIDELNSFIGLLAADMKDEIDLKTLLFIQHKLFTIGSYLATDQKNTEWVVESGISAQSIELLEKEIDRIDGDLPKLKSFILPGGTRTSALAHVCRTVCRRAERAVYCLQEKTEIEENVLIFINRLSDYFFVLGRKECVANNISEIIWNKTCNY